MRTVREMPNAKFDFLRFQLGIMETRPEMTAIWDDKKIIGHKKGSTLVSVFRLIGCGRTIEDAEKMAKKSKFYDPTETIRSKPTGQKAV